MNQVLEFIDKNWDTLIISLIGGLVMYRFFYELIIGDLNRHNELRKCNRCEKEFNSSDQCNTICDECLTELLSEATSAREIIEQSKKDFN